MSGFTARLRVWHKLALVGVFFLLPNSVLLWLFLTAINEDIRFAKWEQYGNEYQQQLEELLDQLSGHLLLAYRRPADGSGDAAKLAEIQSRIDAAFDSLVAVDYRLGERLQFTDEGLAKRNRQHFQARNVRSEWHDLKGQLHDLAPQARFDRHRHLISDIRTMITHVGDTSNLILDPDLDTYYLMDVTLLALPQLQDRLAMVILRGETALQRQSLDRAERRQLHADTVMLKDVDLARIVSSTRTALNEDQYYFGRSDSFQRRVPPAAR